MLSSLTIHLVGLALGIIHCVGREEENGTCIVDSNPSFVLGPHLSPSYSNSHPASPSCPAVSSNDSLQTVDGHIKNNEETVVSFEDWKRVREPSDCCNVSVENSTYEVHQAENSTEIVEELRRPVNRYNYASPDCSARIISASSLTQHASSLLSKSRDRYMLTPCKAEEHWVTIELCDDIRIEAIEISLWEFYSGVIRDIRLSASDDDEADGFHEIASFVGRNVRGAQMFTLAQPTAFHRFLRLDFDSFYGSEYYCPVSHLKVFGMNQMEAFKWEQKKSVHQASAALEGKSIPDEKPVSEQTGQQPAPESVTKTELGELERLVQQEALRTSVAPTKPSAMPPDPFNTTVGEITAANSTHEAESSTRHSTRIETSESIYASINRRLNALEGNSSLIARYVEEQSHSVKSSLVKFAHDWDEWRTGREAVERIQWEQERMRQEDRLGKVFALLEHQRLAVELSQKAMATQIRVLGDELQYERRRGLAQTLILIVVIGLGAISRGSVIDAVLKPIFAEARRRKSIKGTFDGSTDVDMAPRRSSAFLSQRSKTETTRRYWDRSTPRRPGTPNKKRPVFINPSTNSRTSSSVEALGPSTPHLRTSLPMQSTPFRRLAHSSHLHPIVPAKEIAKTSNENDTIIVS